MARICGPIAPHSPILQAKTPNGNNAAAFIASKFVKPDRRADK